MRRHRLRNRRHDRRSQPIGDGGVNLRCADCERIICRFIDPKDGGDPFVDFRSDGRPAPIDGGLVLLTCADPKCGRQHIVDAAVVRQAATQAVSVGAPDVYLGREPRA